MPSYFANVFYENANVYNYNTGHAHDYHLTMQCTERVF